MSEITKQEFIDGICEELARLRARNAVLEEVLHKINKATYEDDVLHTEIVCMIEKAYMKLDEIGNA